MTTDATHFDLAIIGAGSGNSIIDERYDDMRIALCQDGPFGGTCLNVGCIPTKMFVYPADVATHAREAARLGVEAEVGALRWREIRDRVFTDRIDKISAGGEDYRRNRCPNVTVFDGRATFIGPRTLRTGSGDVITADRIVIAAGSRPSVPANVADSGVPYLTNEDAMRLDAPPRRLLVLGSGYIASEFAHVFSAAGSEVTVIARSERLLRHLDEEVSRRFTEIAARRWDVRLGVPTRAFRHDSATGEITVEFEDGSTAVGDALLVATGRTPNGDLLGLDTAGVEMRDGVIVVDEFQRTTAEGVWALGDVSSPFQLKHVANHEARVVRHNLVNPDSMIRSNHDAVPAAVFTHPQIGYVGMTEAEARATGRDITVKVQAYGDVAYGWAMEDGEGFCKVIADRSTKEILGAHILGHEASILLQPFVQAMALGTDYETMATAQYWPHPALTELLENALLGL